MKAIISKPRQFNAMQPKNKEVVNTLTVLAVVNKEIKEIACARFYMGRSASASVVYCCLWLHGDAGASGRGSAGGYGYHKKSAALDEAIESAGIELYGTPYAGGKARLYRGAPINYTRKCHIDGCGSTAMRDALTDIARDILGYNKVTIVES